jgi:hypothetical protein
LTLSHWHLPSLLGSHAEKFLAELRVVSETTKHTRLVTKSLS